MHFIASKEEYHHSQYLLVAQYLHYNMIFVIISIVTSVVFLTLDISNCVSEHKLLRVVSMEIQLDVVQAQFVSLFLKGTVHTIDFNKV